MARSAVRSDGSTLAVVVLGLIVLQLAATVHAFTIYEFQTQPKEKQQAQVRRV
jgi:FlaG/FlaF family flagellin (archaellin)